MGRTKARGKKKGTKEQENDSDENTEVWMGCDTEECKIWSLVLVESGSVCDERETFMCGMCCAKGLAKTKSVNESLKKSVKKLEDEKSELENERKAIEKIVRESESTIEKLKEENKKLQTNVQVLEKDEGVRKQESKKIEKLIDENKIWAGIASRIEEDKVFEKVAKAVCKDDLKKGVAEGNIEQLRKRRMIVFNLNKSVQRTDRQQVRSMFEVLNVSRSISDEDVVSVTRMREKENGQEGEIRPVIVEFKSSFERSLVMKGKAELRENEEYKRVFLVRDLSRDEREEEKRQRLERVRNRGRQTDDTNKQTRQE